MSHANPDIPNIPSTLSRTGPIIQVLFFAPGAPPGIRSLPNSLEAMQELVGGLIVTFETGISGTVGVGNDDALPLDKPLNRTVPATRAQIFGPFFVAGEHPNFRSLTPFELECVLGSLAPELSHRQFVIVMQTLDSGKDWMEMWN